MPDLYSLAPAYPIAPQEWLYPDLLPVGELVLLDGAPGVGKSLICSALATCFSIRLNETKPVLYISSPQQRELLIEFLALQEPVYNLIKGVHFDPAAHNAEASLVQPILDCVDASLKEHQPLMFVIDSLEELLQLGCEPQPRELALLWQSLRTLAQKHRCTLLIPRKNGLHESRAYGPFTRLGSEAARFALTMHWHPIDPSIRVITTARNQRGTVGEQTHVHIRSNGIVYLTYTDAHEHIQPSRSPATWQPAPAHQDEDDRIVNLVEEVMDNKPMPAEVLALEVMQKGFSKRAFTRAMKKAKLKTIRIGNDTCYVPSEKMLMRYLRKQSQEPSSSALDAPKPPESHARTPGAQPCTPSTLRQTG